MRHLHEELAENMNTLLDSGQIQEMTTLLTAHDKQIDAATAGQWVPLNMGEPTEAALRKECPIATGVLDYFPLALQEIARVSLAGNKQHHPDKPLHWDRSKSSDEADALIRHFLDRGKLDTDGLRHSAKMAWRALALLQKEIEADAAFQGQEKIRETYMEALGMLD